MIIGVTNTVQPVSKISWDTRKLARTSELWKYKEDTHCSSHGMQWGSWKRHQNTMSDQGRKKPTFFPQSIIEVNPRINGPILYIC